jgi:hypothetical protein
MRTMDGLAGKVKIDPIYQRGVPFEKSRGCRGDAVEGILLSPGLDPQWLPELHTLSNYLVLYGC